MENINTLKAKIDTKVTRFVLLSVVTGGIYPMMWLYLNQPKLTEHMKNEFVARDYPLWLAIVTGFGWLLSDFGIAISDDVTVLDLVARVLSLASTVMIIVWAFKAKTALQTYALTEFKFELKVVSNSGGRSGGLYVFDVKYKTFDPQFGVKREDIFQLHTYIGQYGNGDLIKGCGFIYPISENRWNALNMDKRQGMISDVIHQQGKDIPFHLLFLKISNDSDPEFNKRMSEECRMFIENINMKVLKNENR